MISKGCFVLVKVVRAVVSKLLADLAWGPYPIFTSLRSGLFHSDEIKLTFFPKVAMILSGDTVLFLDPSRTYLPKGSSFFKRSLSVMQRLVCAHLYTALANVSRDYWGHLKTLHGHFGFNIDTDHFDGVSLSEAPTIIY